MKKLNIVGEKFNKLTVLAEFYERTKTGKVQFICLCECGNKIVTVGSKLVNGHTKSCNCLQKEAVLNTGFSNRTHNKSKTRIYKIWSSMKARCYNPSYESFERYGGRGIIVCDRWKNNFEDFLIDMGYGEKGLSIDRINNDGNYEPNNCKWSTRLEQENNKSTNRHIFYFGQKYTVSQLSRHLNLPYPTVHQWLRKDYSQEKMKEYAAKIINRNRQ